MSQEQLINILAGIGALTVLYVGVRILAAISAWAQRTPEVQAEAPAKAPTPDARAAREPEDHAKNDIVVIAAAVHAMLDHHHRIVHIEDAQGGVAWSSEGRWLHQTSHRTH